MLNRPRIRPHFHVEVVPGEGVLLLSQARHSLLRGRLYERVVPWLDGRTADEVCEQLRAEASPAEVYYALSQLERKDYPCEEEPALPPGYAEAEVSTPRGPVRQDFAARPYPAGAASTSWNCTQWSRRAIPWPPGSASMTRQGTG
jgi:hypothetical protein